jgi:hypothetical protein
VTKVEELLAVIARRTGYPLHPNEPRAKRGQRLLASEFPVSAPGFSGNPASTRRHLFVDIEGLDEDRTFAIDFQAYDLVVGEDTNRLPYGQVEIEYARGGARHSRVIDLTNRCARVFVTGRELRVTIQLTYFQLGSPSTLSVSCSAAEARAGTVEDFPLSRDSQPLAGSPIQAGLEGAVIRAMSFYASDNGFWFMLFNNPVAPVAGALPSYVFGNGTISTSVTTGLAYEINVNTWWAISSSPLTYQVASDASGLVNIQYESGFGIM